jgi:hypothetical protein
MGIYIGMFEFDGPFAIFPTDLPEDARTSIVQAIELEFDEEPACEPQLEQKMSKQSLV